MSEQVRVFYLARAAEGMQPLERFARSYKAFSPGRPHRVTVIYKGFDAEPETPLKKLLHDRLFVSDDLTDIGSYIEAAQQCQSDYVCFLNTFSEILAPDWLAILHREISKNSVGIVGASGSWESIHDTFEYLGKCIWLAETRNIRVHTGMMRQFGPYLRLHAPRWVARYAATPLPMKLWSRIRPAYTAADAVGFAEYWDSVTAPGAPVAAYRDIPRFPNPHVRSNGFIIRRADFLGEFPSIAIGKHAAHMFESGASSLTRRMFAARKSALVVNREGKAYSPEEWCKSDTFRLGRQTGLLIGDNQTRNYEAMPRAERETHAYLAWGIKPRSPGFLTLGMNFESRRLQNNQTAWVEAEPTVSAARSADTIGTAGT